MTVLIAYGTIEGQTRKIAEFVAKQARDNGENVVLFDTSNKIGDLEFEGVDRVILAAPVHERRHPKAFEIFVDTNRKVGAFVVDHQGAMVTTHNIDRFLEQFHGLR